MNYHTVIPDLNILMGHVNFPILAINTYFPSLLESVLLLAIKILTLMNSRMLFSNCI